MCWHVFRDRDRITKNAAYSAETVGPGSGGTNVGRGRALWIKTTASFITGYPEEQQDDQEATLDMLGNCFRRPAKSCIPQLHMLMPEPGTGLYNQYGQQLKYDGYITDYNSWLLDKGDEQFNFNDPEIFVTYYFYPASMPRENYIFAVDVCRELRKLGHIVLNYALEILR